MQRLHGGGAVWSGILTDEEREGGYPLKSDKVTLERSSRQLCGERWFWVRWAINKEAGAESREERLVAWTKALAPGTEKAWREIQKEWTRLGECGTGARRGHGLSFGEPWQEVEVYWAKFWHRKTSQVPHIRAHLWCRFCHLELSLEGEAVLRVQGKRTTSAKASQV